MWFVCSRVVRIFLSSCLAFVSSIFWFSCLWNSPLWCVLLSLWWMSSCRIRYFMHSGSRFGIMFLFILIVFLLRDMDAVSYTHLTLPTKA